MSAQKAKGSRWIRQVLPRLRAHPWLLTAILLTALIYIAATLFSPILMGEALDLSLGEIYADEASKEAALSSFWAIVTAMAVLAFVGAISQFLFEYTANVLTQIVVKDTRDSVFTKMTHLPISAIDSRPHGDIMSLATVDTENIMAGLTAILKSLIEGVLTLVFTIAFMYWVNWILATVVLLLTPMSFLVSRFVSTRTRKHFTSQAKYSGDLAGVALERIRNYRAVRAMSIQNESQQEFESVDQELYKAGQKAQFFSSWANPTTRLCNNIVYVCVGIAGIAVLFGQSTLGGIGASLTVGGLSTFLTYALKFAKPFNDLSSVTTEFQQASASYSRIDALLSLSDERDDTPAVRQAPGKLDTIEFRDITFGYEPDRKVIDGLDLEVFSRHRVAIVGPTGCGKTTLINLLLRFYDPQSGEILLGGENSSDMSRSDVRSKFGMVLQDTWIFTGTVRDNIAYAKPDATDEEVRQAADRAQATHFIERLPRKFDTVISSDSGLSEGEKQLISIARVLLMNPGMIILDEATSSLDAVSEKSITAAIAELSSDRTTIVIAHRLQTIVDSDAIAVMKGGKVVEIGNHAQLMERKGFYYTLYTSQYQ